MKTAEEVKRRLADDVGQLAADNGLDSDDVFYMIRVNNDLHASKWWYGFGKRSNFFNNELHKFAESRFNDWFEFTGEIVRQLDERKLKKKAADPVLPDKPSVVKEAYETVFHLAKVISGGRIDRFQMVHMAEAMLWACRAYVDAEASDSCGLSSGKLTAGYYRDEGDHECDRQYCPYRDDHTCRHSSHACAYCGDAPSSAWRPEGIPLSEMPEEARRICEDFDRKAAEAANGAFAAKDKVNNKENKDEATDTGD